MPQKPIVQQRTAEQNLRETQLFFDALKNMANLPEDIQRAQELRKQQRDLLQEATRVLSDAETLFKGPPSLEIPEKTLPKNFLTTVLLPVATAIAAYNRPQLGQAMTEVAQKYEQQLQAKKQEELAKWEMEQRAASGKFNALTSRANLLQNIANALGEESNRIPHPSSLIGPAVSLMNITAQDETNRAALALDWYKALLRQGAESGNVGEDLFSKTQRAISRLSSLVGDYYKVSKDFLTVTSPDEKTALYSHQDALMNEMAFLAASNPIIYAMLDQIRDPVLVSAIKARVKMFGSGDSGESMQSDINRPKATTNPPKESPPGVNKNRVMELLGLPDNSFYVPPLGRTMQ